MSGQSPGQVAFAQFERDVWTLGFGSMFVGSGNIEAVVCRAKFPVGNIRKRRSVATHIQYRLKGERIGKAEAERLTVAWIEARAAISKAEASTPSDVLSCLEVGS